MEETQKIDKITTKKYKVKRQLYLLVISSWLIVSTYAWLTSNTFVKVEAFDINVQTTDGLQISVDAENWKTVLTREDVITGESWAEHSNHISENKRIKPVSTIGEVNSAGRLRMFLGTAEFDPSLKDFNLALTATELEDNIETEKYVAFDIFLKSEQPLDIYLDVESTIVSTPNMQGVTKGLENAVRVAFVNQGQIDSRTYRTPSGPGYIRSLSKAEQVVIWEPNSDSHTNAAVSNAFNEYGVTIGAYDAITSYSGVKNIITKPILLRNTNFMNSPEHFGEVKVGQNTSFSFIQTPKPLKDEARYKKGQDLYYMNTGGDAPLDNPVNLGLKIQSGVIKIRVYMWIEGQDYDCEDFAPGTDLQFNLSFSGER